MSSTNRNAKNRSQQKKKKLGRKGGGRQGAPAMSKSQGTRNQKSRQNRQELKRAPAAQSRDRKTNRPKFSTLPNGDAIIAHREYIADVTAGTTTGFNNTQFPINPGLRGTFLWLSKIAQNYESYRFEYLRFCYETQSSSSVGGTLMMAVDYDSTDAAPGSKSAAMAFRGTVRSAPWNECKHISLREDLRKLPMFTVRTGAQPANTDLKTIDVGTLNVATQGIVANTLIGELWVEYKVRFFTAQSDTLSQGAVGGTITGGGVFAVGNPMGTVPVLGAGETGVTIDALSVLTFPFTGTYLVDILYTGTGLLTEVMTPSAGINVPQRWVVINAATTVMGCSHQIKVNQPGTVALTTTATTITAASLHIALAPESSIL